MYRITLLKNKIKEVILASKLAGTAPEDTNTPVVPKEPEK